MIRSPLLIDSLIILLFHLHARDSGMIEIEKLTKRQIPSNAEIFRVLIIEVLIIEVLIIEVITGLNGIRFITNQ
jgi:hypothetical protein